MRLHRFSLTAVEIRHLKVDENISRRDDRYFIKNTKQNKRSGLSQEINIPKFLTSDINEWLTKWRKKIPSEDNYMF